MFSWIRGQILKQKRLFIDKYPVFKNILYWATRFLKSGYGVLTVVIALCAIPDIRKEVHNWFASDEELWKEKTYIKGLKLPDIFLDESSIIIIQMGTIMQEFSASVLSDTAVFPNSNTGLPISFEDGSMPFHLKFLLKKNRLYLSTVLKDIDDKYVGMLNFSEFEIRPSKISNYHDGDDNFEIIDENNYVLFNFKFVKPNIILIGGYSIDNYRATIANGSSLSFVAKEDPNYRNKAIRAIQQIIPLNKY